MIRYTHFKCIVQRVVVNSSFDKSVCLSQNNFLYPEGDVALKRHRSKNQRSFQIYLEMEA